MRKPHDANSPPRVQYEQVPIFRQNHVNTCRQGKAEHVVVLGITTIIDGVQRRINALTVAYHTGDQCIYRLCLDSQPRTACNQAKFLNLFAMIDESMAERREH